MIQTLTKQETEKVKEYADWLREGKDKLEFRMQCFGKWYETRNKFGCCVTVWNETKHDSLCEEYSKGLMTYSFSLEDDSTRTYCTQPHKCDDHDHLDYFKPIAESLYRKYILKKLTGDLFQCS